MILKHGILGIGSYNGLGPYCVIERDIKSTKL